jgi:hypothetical protein
MTPRQAAVLALSLLISTPSFGNPSPPAPPPPPASAPAASAGKACLLGLYATVGFLAYFVYQHYARDEK